MARDATEEGGMKVGKRIGKFTIITPSDLPMFRSLAILGISPLDNIPGLADPMVANRLIDKFKVIFNTIQPGCFTAWVWDSLSPCFRDFNSLRKYCNYKSVTGALVFYNDWNVAELGMVNMAA